MLRKQTFIPLMPQWRNWGILLSNFEEFTEPAVPVSMSIELDRDGSVELADIHLQELPL